MGSAAEFHVSCGPAYIEPQDLGLSFHERSIGIVRVYYDELMLNLFIGAGRN